MPRSAHACLLCLMLLTLATGCEVNRAQRAIKPTSASGVSMDTVRITGPYSITEDGNVTWVAVPRPDGDLLGTRIGRELTIDAVQPWIRSATSASGGSIGRVRAITGPYRLEPDDPDTPQLYDVTLEVWTSRSPS